jgi:predicted ester cyclase
LPELSDLDTAERNKAVTLALFDEAWANGDVDAYDRYAHPDVVLHLAGYSQPFRGREAVKEWVRTYRGAFPDISIDIDAIVADGDEVWMRWTSEQTHTGEYMGIPPTRKHVRMNVLETLRFVEGRFIEVHILFDPLRVMQQLGVFPEGTPPRPVVYLLRGLTRLSRLGPKRT